MRALLLATMLLLSGVVAVPVAAAEPCEVPGCTFVGAAVCFVANAKDLVKHTKETVRECTTVTA